MIFEIDPLFIKNNIDKHRLLRAYSVFVETGKNMSFWYNQPRVGKVDKITYPFLIYLDRQILYDKCD